MRIRDRQLAGDVVSKADRPFVLKEADVVSRGLEITLVTLPGVSECCTSISRFRSVRKFWSATGSADYYATGFCRCDTHGKRKRWIERTDGV